MTGRTLGSEGVLVNKTIVLAAIAACLSAATPAGAAPFATITFKKGESALIYDIGSVTRDGAMARAWVYTFVLQPMEGATLVATYREFSCGLGRTRDLARRFADAEGMTLRAVEQPDAWQWVEPGAERAELLRQVCTAQRSKPIGTGLSVFQLQTVVRDALAIGPVRMGAR